MRDGHSATANKGVAKATVVTARDMTRRARQMPESGTIFPDAKRYPK